MGRVRVFGVVFRGGSFRVFSVCGVGGEVGGFGVVVGVYFFL